jgi:hypothetical protein
MKRITELDYMILKYIPVYPEERSRGDIVRLIKEEDPYTYEDLTTIVFDATLLKFTYIFPLIEEKIIPKHVFFADTYTDTDVLQSTLEPLPLDWVYDNIGEFIDTKEDEVYLDLIGKKIPKSDKGWYRQSDFRFDG